MAILQLLSDGIMPIDFAQARITMRVPYRRSATR